LLGPRGARTHRHTTCARNAGESVEIKRSNRRVDLLLRPVDPGSDAPIYVIELWRKADPDADRKLLRKALDVAERRGVDRERVVAVNLFVTDVERRGMRSAEVGPRRRRTISFAPIPIVLRAISPSKLLRRGGAALAALPLVGSDEQALASAAAWQRRLRATATLVREERAEAERLFLLLLVDRFKDTKFEAILGEEGLMQLEKTATGKEMIKRAEARGAARVLRGALEASVRDRFGRWPRPLATKLKAIDDPGRLTALIVQVGRAESLADVVALLG
jgi:hypothetical protein